MGMLRPANVAGMVMGHRDDPCVRVREDLTLPVCDACGDMALNEEDTDALDAALERSYRRKRLRQQRAMINDLRRAGLTQVQIERFATLSPGYVSKLRKGKLASGATFRLLYLLHALPREALRVVSRLDPELNEARAKLESPAHAG
jgi:C4-dicarboxylate-specific signal transduction histidine kinase